ncbi:Hypothetical protein (Fragment) [Durusdinium trenchii]|uniref:EamA domain-containing protein n=1 Tax=Durusdinium trenchii TaxID=1381693 RepID=A0ABP0RS00_9DINO
MYLITATGPAFNPCGQISIAFMLLFQKKLNLRWLGPPGSQRWLILKGVLQVSFITCWWTALQRAPVGNCVAIIYSSPILTSVFSRLLLKEPLGSQFPLQVGLLGGLLGG